MVVLNKHNPGGVINILKIGLKLKQMLKLKGMTQRELAQKAGVSLSIIKALVNDRRTTTTTDTILKIAHALQISPAHFFPETALEQKNVAFLPSELQELFTDATKLDYLLLAKKMADLSMPVEVAEKFLDTYAVIVKNKKDGQS